MLAEIGRFGGKLRIVPYIKRTTTTATYKLVRLLFFLVDAESDAMTCRIVSAGNCPSARANLCHFGPIKSMVVFNAPNGSFTVLADRAEQQHVKIYKCIFDLMAQVCKAGESFASDCIAERALHFVGPSDTSVHII